jgi:16S rRNA processing protein RimM
VGSVLGTDPTAVGPLTVVSSRWHSGRLLISFAEIADRTQAESLRGVWLTVDAAQISVPDDPDEFHDQELVGLTVVTSAGGPVGVVADVRHHGQDLLVIQPAAGSQRQGEILVPFVAAIVVDVDVAGGQMVIDPPPGLLELSGGLGAAATGGSAGTDVPGSAHPGRDRG